MKQVKFEQDERQQAINHKATTFGFAFLIVCLFVSTVYRVVTTDNIGWEFFAILGSCIVIWIARRFMGDIEEPRGINNQPLPLGDTKEDKKIRFKNYVMSSGIFGLSFAVMDILLIGFGKEDVTDYEFAKVLFPSLSKGTTIAVTAVIAFATMFAISLVGDSLIGERKVKKYNRMLKELDDEDQDE